MVCHVVLNKEWDEVICGAAASGVPPHDDRIDAREPKRSLIRVVGEYLHVCYVKF